VPHAKALGAPQGLLGDPRVHPTGVAWSVLVAMPGAEAAPGLMDRLIQGDSRRDGGIRSRSPVLTCSRRSSGGSC
jgi:hypothetical protein